MTTYYMRADGSAANKAAATSIAAAATSMSMTTHNSETFSAGDVIVLSSLGGVFRGLSAAVMPVPSSGASGNPIIYTNDSAEASRPTISAAADLTSSTYKWTASGSGTNEYYCELAGGGDPSIGDPTDVWTDNSRGTEGTAGALTDGQYDYGDNDTLGYSTVYYRSDAGDPDTLSIQIEAAQANNPIVATGDDYLEFIGLDLQMGQQNGMIINGGLTGVTVRDCKMRYNTTNGILIFDVGAAVSTFITLDGNECAYNVTSGISMLEENNNVTIKNNLCHDNTFSGAGTLTGGINVKCEDDARCNDLLIEGNTCYNNGSGVSGQRGFGFYIDTVGTGCIIRYNKAYSNFVDGMVLEWTTGAKVYYNVCYSNNVHGFAFIRRNNENEIYNNTSYDNGLTDSSGSSYIFNGVSEGPTNVESDNTFKNNIGFGANGKEVRVHSGWVNDGTNGSGNVYDSNILADQSGTWHNWNDTLYTSASAWESAGTGVTNTDGSDPDVVDEDNADFSLNWDSPARNAGVGVGLTLDIAGIAVPQRGLPDIGAYEFLGVPVGESTFEVDEPTNNDASEDAKSRYEICARSGFKQYPIWHPDSKLVRDGYGDFVRIQSYDDRHPQEFIRSSVDMQEGLERPEPATDSFISASVVAEDL